MLGLGCIEPLAMGVSLADGEPDGEPAALGVTVGVAAAELEVAAGLGV